jgi:hypothetical protein
VYNGNKNPIKEVILMLNKICLLILSLTISLLTACGSSPTVSQPQIPLDIRKDLYSDTVDLLNLYSSYVENGKESFSTISRKADYYHTKYNQLTDLNTKEKELTQLMAVTLLFAEKYSSAYSTGNENDKKENLLGFLSGKQEINKILGLK